MIPRELERKFGREKKKSQKTPGSWTIKEHAEQTKQSVTPVLSEETSLKKELAV